MTGSATNLLRILTGAMRATLLITAFSTVSAGATLSTAHDLAADAKSAAHFCRPLIVLVSLAGCPHCEVVRRSHLLPLLRDETVAPKPTIRQVEINGRENLLDFNGQAITHAEFAQRYNINIAPAVLFLDVNGQLLTEPLMGSMIPEFYGAYFDAALNKANATLRAAQKH